MAGWTGENHRKVRTRSDQPMSIGISQTQIRSTVALIQQWLQLMES